MNEYIISSFKTLTGSKSKDVSIFKIFDAIKKCILEKEIIAIRQATDKKVIENLKKKLPCITTSGTFRNSHKADDIISHSGLIQIDIDNVPARIPDLVPLLKKDRYTFSSFISPRGNGIKLVVKIPPEPENHLKYFLGLKSYYKLVFEVDIDNSCKDICRVMFLSADKNIFVNKDSGIFTMLSQEIISKKTLSNALSMASSTDSDFDKLLEQITTNRIDITNNYQNWLSVGFGLADHFGANGRDYFHSLSSFNQEYDFTKCNKQFDACLKSKRPGITIKTIFQLAKEHGIIISPHRNSTRPDIVLSRTVKPKTNSESAWT